MVFDDAYEEAAANSELAARTENLWALEIVELAAAAEGGELRALRRHYTDPR